MKTLKLIFNFFILCLILVSNQAWGLSAESYQVERRIQDVLSTYLEPTEFLVVIRELENKNVYTESAIGANLPGAPGLASDAQSAKYRGYFDVDGKLQNAKARPPIQVEVILSREVNNETKSLIRRLIPSIAGINKEYGDKVQIKNGNIDSPARKKWESNSKSDNWIDSIVKFRKEISALVLGLLTALAALIFINGILGVFKERQKGASVNAQPKASDSSDASEKLKQKMSNYENLNEMSSLIEDVEKQKTAINNNRENYYQKESAFFNMVEEIRAQADQFPERVGELLKRWIQEGDVGVRNASILLRNFKFPIVEKVMSKMVASDLTSLQNFLDLEFDFFSSQNERVILTARQELMKIVASQSHNYQVRDMDFLGLLETHILNELLRDEPIRTLVVASVAIPSNRMAEILKTFTQTKQNEYFNYLVSVDRAEPGEVEKIKTHLTKKLKTLDQLLLTDDQKSDSIVLLLKNLSSESRKIQILDSILTQNKNVYLRVRSQITLFTDVESLPDRALKILTGDIDAVVVARAFCRSTDESILRIKNNLPKSSQEIFDFEMANKASIPEEQVYSSQMTLVQKLEQLVFEKIVSGIDLNRNFHSAPKSSITKAA